MAAGQGFKTFTTGEVLTAGDVNGYLMQGVLVFASAAARDAAITSPQEGQFAFTKDTNGLWYYDGATWVASGATGDIEGVTAGTGISGGGTSGTVTITNSMATAIDAKGDLVAGTGADAFSRLAVGANNTVLTADSTAATGLKWAASAAGGMTLLSTSSLAGVVSLTISGISGSYNDLKIVVANVSCNNLRPEVRIMSANACFYNVSVADSTTTSVQNYNGNDIKLSPNINLGNLNPYNAWTIMISRYSSGDSYKSFQYFGAGNLTNKPKVNGGGIYDGIPAIDSIEIISTSGNTISSGDVYIYGVK